MLQRIDHSCLKKDGQSLLFCLRKALFGGNTDFTKRIRFRHWMTQNILFLDLFLHNRILVVFSGLIHHIAALQQTAPNHLQFRIVLIQNLHLPPQKRGTVLQIVIFHMFPNLFQRKTDFCLS